MHTAPLTGSKTRDLHDTRNTIDENGKILLNASDQDTTWAQQAYVKASNTRDVRGLIGTYWKENAVQSGGYSEHANHT